MDNGTMVEALKYLNYCQLATNSLVSVRIRNVIETHRHTLALFYVDTISMELFYRTGPAVIKICNQELSPGEYNEWVVRNSYSKQISPEPQAAGNQYDYELSAYGGKGIAHKAHVFFARVQEINSETWPLFQHFVRLLTDPFVYIRYLGLLPRHDVIDLLAATINSRNSGPLQCDKLDFDFEDYAPNFFNWIKDHVRCILQIASSHGRPNHDKQLLDFFATGSHCTSEVAVISSHISSAVVVDFVQKFVDLKSSDESQMVKIFRGNVSTLTVDALESNYAQFLINEKKERGWDRINRTTARVFEIINNDIGKKMRLTVKNQILYRGFSKQKSQVILEIINL